MFICGRRRVEINKPASQQASNIAFGAIADRIGVWFCLVSYLGIVQVASTPSVTGDLVLRLLWSVSFVVGLLALCEIVCCSGWHRWSWQALGLILGLAASSTWYAFSQHTWAAWLSLVVMYVSLAWLDRTVVAALVCNRVGRWIARLILAGAGGFLPIILSQIEGRFSDEEFFVFVQGIALVVFCLLFLSGQSYLDRRRVKTENIIDRPTCETSLVIIGGLTSMMIGLGVWGLVAYQHSFYTSEAPAYPGITETTPFVCGQVAADPQQPSGVDVYRQLLARVEANPYKRPSEFALLALGTHQQCWAEVFRDAILAEARAGRFTGPANSVKSTQHEAALGAYYAPRVRAAFPGLFTDQDWSTLQMWFAAVNRRALAVEWVDWMYALAFSKWPEGPYENQENGAGLLAMLEQERLGAPELSEANRDYLRRYVRGWAARFRNTDDAYIYQPEWISNALFQFGYDQSTGGEPEIVKRNRRLSFEWLLLQALPDGSALTYNHPSRLSLAGISYLGARLLSDARYVWLTERALSDLEQRDGFMPAQPGIEVPIPLSGASPLEGSCLLYGDSGLPNQSGPLAPDKVVFRDSWSPEAAYLLLNLRFTGWHRYKATNTVTLLYENGPIVVEQSTDQPIGWLPRGRAAFRDKRVPRENLNGLLIPQSGMARVLQILTGVGNAWSQDPPPYAQVERFETLGALDFSRTAINDWRSWSHTRAVYFVPQGPVIVIDSAQGSGQPAIAWHLVGEGRRDGNSMWLRESPLPVRMILPLEAWQSTSIEPIGAESDKGDLGLPNWNVMYHSPVPGQLHLATVFLLGQWASAQYEAQSLPGGWQIRLTDKDKSLILLQNDSAQWLQTQDAATDGRWVLVLQQNRSRQVCFEGGTRTQVNLGSRPANVFDAGERMQFDWEWMQDELVLHNATPDTTICLNVME